MKKVTFTIEGGTLKMNVSGIHVTERYGIITRLNSCFPGRIRDVEKKRGAILAFVFTDDITPDDAATIAKSLLIGGFNPINNTKS